MKIAQRFLLLAGFAVLSPLVRAESPTENDQRQKRINEEAYRHRFDREASPPAGTGIRVAESRPDGIIPLPLILSPQWKLTLMTGDDSINAFDNARKKLHELFRSYGIDESIQLSRRASEQTNGVRATSLTNLEKALSDHHIQDGDGCLIHMTSHGSPQSFYIRGQDSLTPDRLNQMLKNACGNRPTVLLVSACYSGIFAEPKMEAPNRIILTAARKDKTSFGCGAEEVYTYWDACLVTTLPTVRTWLELSQKIEKCIELKEGAGSFARSYPQARFGADVKDLEIRQSP